MLILSLEVFGSFQPAAASVVLQALAMEHGLVGWRLTCHLCGISLVLCHLQHRLLLNIQYPGHVGIQLLHSSVQAMWTFSIQTMWTSSIQTMSASIYSVNVTEFQYTDHMDIQYTDHGHPVTAFQYTDHVDIQYTDHGER